MIVRENDQIKGASALTLTLNAIHFATERKRLIRTIKNNFFIYRGLNFINNIKDLQILLI